MCMHLFGHKHEEDEQDLATTTHLLCEYYMWMLQRPCSVSGSPCGWPC